MILDTIAIQAILPHRYPFLLVDSIIEIEGLKRIVGTQSLTVSPADPGHIAATAQILEEVTGGPAEVRDAKRVRAAVSGDQALQATG